MISVLIFEDEPLSAKRIVQLLEEFDTEINVLATLESIEEGVEWFNANKEPDLILMDIHLSDGQSFDIFEQVQIICPVIFITAYDQYAIKAFKLNSIDYLLKPLDKTEFFNALSQYKDFRADANAVFDYKQLNELVGNLEKKHKSRFLVKYGDTILFKSIEDVAYFYADDKVVYLCTNDNRKYLIDYNLESLEELLDPHAFFRLNRKFICKIESIQKIKTGINGKLQVFLNPAFESEIYISRERSSLFKAWIDN